MWADRLESLLVFHCSASLDVGNTVANDSNWQNHGVPHPDRTDDEMWTRGPLLRLGAYENAYCCKIGLCFVAAAVTRMLVWASRMHRLHLGISMKVAPDVVDGTHPTVSDRKRTVVDGPVLDTSFRHHVDLRKDDAVSFYHRLLLVDVHTHVG